jgi:hypothetical protein
MKLCLLEDLRGRKWREARGDSVMRSFITCTPHLILLGGSSQGGWGGGSCSTNGRNEKYLLTYLLTTWCRIFFEKLIVIQLVKK